MRLIKNITIQDAIKQLEDLKQNQLSFVSDWDRANKENIFVQDAQAIEKVIKELKKKDRMIDEMAETIIEDSYELGTYWCNGCTKVAECPYKEQKECVKQNFGKKVEE